MTRAQLQRLKGILETEQAAAARRLNQRRYQISADKCSDHPEETCYNGEHELAFANLSRDSDLMRDIQAALHRIECGTFGVCLSCGDTIGPKRLAAVPWSPLCIRCQEAADGADADTPNFLRGVQASAA